MRRREFIGLVGGAVATWPRAVIAQQAAGKLHRIGILSPERLPPGLLEDFRQGLSGLGYIEGRNITFEIRSAEDGQELAALAAELVELKVDLILAINTPAVQAAKKATGKIPIVMTRIADPVKSGLVASLSRPGGNITGVSFMTDELSGKRLELLKEALPGVSRVAAIWNAGNAGSTIVVDQLKAPSKKLGLELLLLPIQDPTYLFGAFQAAKAGRVQAVIVIDDAVITRHAAEVFNLAASILCPLSASLSRLPRLEHL